MSIGQDVAIEEIQKDYDAVYIAIGAHVDKKLGLEGEESSNVISAVELLRGVGDGNVPDFTGKKICVIGGGNVSMDATRTALRLGAESVTCVSVSYTHLDVYKRQGLSCVQVHMTNTSNLPIESMEIEFPYMVEQYTLVPDSGGPGKFRGGLSMSKDIRVLGHDSQFTIKADRQKTPPWGLFGGQPGLPGVITIYPGTDQEAVIDSKKSGTTLKSGGVLRCQMPGAGGYGNPLERDRALIVHDLEEGYITPESALRDYGLTEEDLAQIEVFGKT